MALRIYIIKKSLKNYQKMCIMDSTDTVYYYLQIITFIITWQLINTKVKKCFICPASEINLERPQICD